MIKYRTLEALTDVASSALIDLLYRLGDDELITGYRGSDSLDLLLAGDERPAFSSIAADEIQHAGVYYEVLHQLGEADPDVLMFTRGPREFRSASLADLVPCQDRESVLLRQFLYDAAENVRLSALCASSLAPLAQLARGLLEVEKAHLTQGRGWVLRLAGASRQSGERLQKALDGLYPHALGLFEPTEADEPLAQTGVCPHEEELRRHWESAVAPVLAGAGVSLPETVRAVHGGRVGRHSHSLTELLERVRRSHATRRAGRETG